MIQKIKFRTVKCPFQRKMSSDLQTNIETSNHLLVPAGKTFNFYKMDSNTYNNLLLKTLPKPTEKLNQTP